MKKRFSAYRRPIQRGVNATTNSRLTKADILRKMRLDDGCWIWPDTRNTGHPVHHVHRRSYELWHGPIPKGAQVHHTCGRKACVNPAHLKAVTRSYNARMSYLDRRKQMPWYDLRAAAEVHAMLTKKLQGDQRVDMT